MVPGVSADAKAPGTEIEIVQVPVDLIDKNSWNPNIQSEIVARATRESLEHYGFVEPVLLRPHPTLEGRYEMVNGEHRWEEARTLGAETVPAVVRDLSDSDAKKLTVVLNETTGEADVVLLGRLLADLQGLDDFQIALPYTEAELAHLLSIGAEDWDSYGDAPAPDPAPPPSDPTDEVELVVLLTPQRRDQFRDWVMVLEKEWHIDGGVSGVVWEAVRRAALAAHQGD